jgi:hypothetical protein
VEEAFSTELARARKRCRFSVDDDESTEVEVNAHTTWCYDEHLHLQLYEESNMAEGSGAKAVLIAEYDAIRCAKDSEHDRGRVAVRVYCDGLGGQVTDFDAEPRAMTMEEQGEFLLRAAARARPPELPLRNTEGGCSVSYVDPRCYGENPCFKPRHTISVSTELCDKADALQTGIDAYVSP